MEVEHTSDKLVPCDGSYQRRPRPAANEWRHVTGCPVLLTHAFFCAGGDVRGRADDAGAGAGAGAVSLCASRRHDGLT